MKKLAEAGLTHVHLLPSFDFSSVDERKETWKTVGKFQACSCYLQFSMMLHRVDSTADA